MVGRETPCTTKQMATKKKTGKPLVIVESPAKARTISKFLGNDYVIEASIGHIRDLPANAAEVPAKYKSEKWSRLGIDVENDFAPLYVVPPGKREHMRNLKKLCQDASIVYLATDEDREGESISWHLVDELNPKVEIKRLVFHEITKDAIQHALDNPREIDQNLVEAQETRRLVDRLFGYSVSPLLWKKIRPKLSAGRVQSVAVRLVVEREQDRLRFIPSDYWGVTGQFEVEGQDPFDATLARVGDQRLARGKDFDPDTGKLKADPKSVLHLTGGLAKDLVARLSGQQATVESLIQKPFTESPRPPFTTSTLQQEAGRKLGFTARRAMSAAQRLYENGYITYMRTDSTTLSGEALTAARSLIKTKYGAENLPDSPRAYATKVKNAQEAHEAIRPAGSDFCEPENLGQDMGADERRLYELIFRRAVSSQMKDAKGQRTTLTIAIDDARFTTSGRTIQFHGFRLAYIEQSDTGKGESEQDRLLPDVKEGQAVGTKALNPEGHTTKPPARLTEASLIKELEARGIGRPSTYASIIETILKRNYCFKKGTALVPTFTAFAVIQLLHQHLTYLVDYEFTAKMEDDLDEISNGRKNRLDYLSAFFLGNGKPGLQDQLNKVGEEIDPRKVCTVKDYDFGKIEDDVVEVRVGRYGPFLSSGSVSATLPDELPPDELTREKALDILAKAAAGPKSLGNDPETGHKIFVKEGRFGPYFQRGDAESLGDEKPKMASLVDDMKPETVTLEDGLACLALPRNVGALTLPEAEDGGGETHDVFAHNGKFGPYLVCHKSTRSLPTGESLLKVSLARAIELFKEPKKHGRRQAAAPKVIKVLGKHPTSEEEIKILDGRYGPYVTDGSVNATVPRDEKPEEMGLARGVELIDAKAAAGPRKKKKAAKKATKKAAKKTTKKAAKKTTTKKAAKKTAKKATAKKKSD